MIRSLKRLLKVVKYCWNNNDDLTLLGLLVVFPIIWLMIGIIGCFSDIKTVAEQDELEDKP